MAVDPFADRLARVRHRFVSTLEGKIEDAYAATAKLSGAAPDAAGTVSETYRSMHGIVGIGPTVGFPVTGQTAREVESVLRPAHQEGRQLKAEEVLLLKKRLHALREAAKRELQSFYAV